MREIRLFKPDIMVTTNPEHMIIRFAKDQNWGNHRDHRNTARAALDAAYPYSRDISFFPEQFKQKGVSSHMVTEFLLCDYYDHPDVVCIDVTDTVQTRIRAHAAHSSQYSLADARDSADFFTQKPFPGSRRRYERFRYVITD